jgi:enoyl-CoA hydratase/carnithine racemase
VIELDQDGSVFVLRLRGGENRFSMELLDEVNAALDRVQAIEGPCALVTTGEGKFYSNGMDLDWLATAPDRAGEYLRAIYRLLGRVLSFPAPTVAAVNGHAFGGGALLAIAHDFAVMRADRGYWCMPEADLGLPLTPEYLSLLQTRLPARTLHEALVTGKRYGGRDALDAGIVQEVASEDDVLPAAVAIAASLAGKDRRTLAEHKRCWADRLVLAGRADGESSQRREEVPGELVAERREELALDLVARPAGQSQAVLARGGEFDDVLAPVLRAAMPAHQSLALQRVHERDHRGPVDAQLVGCLLLGERNGRQYRQHRQLAAVDPERRQSRAGRQHQLLLRVLEEVAEAAREQVRDLMGHVATVPVR